MAIFSFQLPWPPSVNRYWRNVGRRTLLSEAGRKYARAACLALQTQKPQGFKRLDAPVAISLLFLPPDRRKRDLDNCLKAVFDCCTKAGLWLDDSLAHEIHAIRGEVTQGGEVHLTIWPRGEA